MSGFRVMVGKECLQFCDTYGEAVEVMRMHDRMRVSGPYARIVEVR